MPTANLHAPTAPRRPRHELVLAGILFLLVTAYFSWSLLSAWYGQYTAHRHFVPVSALIVEAGVASRGSAASAHGTSYYPQMVYRYRVAGKEYESRRHFFTGPGWSDYAAAQAVVAAQPAGSIVQAYVDPAEPATAVLDRRKPDARIFLWVLPFSAFSIFLVFLGLRRK